jgi:hypothetical protein
MNSDGYISRDPAYAFTSGQWMTEVGYIYL